MFAGLYVSGLGVLAAPGEERVVVLGEREQRGRVDGRCGGLGGVNVRNRPTLAPLVSDTLRAFEGFEPAADQFEPGGAS